MTSPKVLVRTEPLRAQLNLRRTLRISDLYAPPDKFNDPAPISPQKLDPKRIDLPEPATLGSAATMMSSMTVLTGQPAGTRCVVMPSSAN